MTDASQRAKKQQARARRAERLLYAAEDGLLVAVEKNGNVLRGVSVRMGQDDCLMTLRGVVDGANVVSFVGGETLAGVLLKAASEARNDKLKWKEDKWD